MTFFQKSNPKNRLQEFCQQNTLGLPIYDSDKMEDGLFHSKATILYQHKLFFGHGKSLKIREAEKEAAEQILATIHERQLSQIQLVSRKDTAGFVAIYIDMENINVNELTDLFKLYKYNPKHFIFRGFLSIGHHYSETNFKFEGIAFEKILVPSTRSDAADIGMIMHAMTAISLKHASPNIPAHLIFVSRDRFSCVFIELGDKGFCIDGNVTKVSHCSNVSQLKEVLK
jgi:Double-stranded RNA binding motif